MMRRKMLIYKHDFASNGGQYDFWFKKSRQTPLDLNRARCFHMERFVPHLEHIGGGMMSFIGGQGLARQRGGAPC